MSKDILRELIDLKQHENEGFRRWFASNYFDIIFWFSDENQTHIDGVQICYDKEGNERALTYRSSGSLDHMKIDSGETEPGYKGTPILVQDGLPDMLILKHRFIEQADNLDDRLSAYVIDVLEGNSGLRD
jgi:hypothetical protein